MFEDEEKTDTAEIYLCFFHNVGSVFDQLVKKLELTDNMKQTAKTQTTEGNNRNRSG